MLPRSRVDRLSMNRAQGSRSECPVVGKRGAVETKELNPMWGENQSKK